MAIVNDLDRLSRHQVIFNTTNQLISLEATGDLVDLGGANEMTGTAGSTAASLVFTVGGGLNPTTAGVAAGDILCIHEGANAGHYVIASATATTVTVETTDQDGNTIDKGAVGAESDFTAFSVDTGLVWDIREPNQADGPVQKESGTDGNPTESTNTFVSAGSTFQTNGVSSGDNLSITTGPQAGNYRIETITNETTLEVSPAFTATATSGETFTVDRYSLFDGVTKQALYSFSKTQWLNDFDPYGVSDDLIRHEFPFEGITREQMELGGGSAHYDWDYFSERTRRLVRTGGWASKNNADTLRREDAGIITLGTIPTTTQVYYQPVSVITTKVNFVLTGPVNQAIKIFEDSSTEFGGTDNTRAFLKLFARAKGQTYAGSQISDIGVSSLETIVNRFPLATAADPAIVAFDGSLENGESPWAGNLDTIGSAETSKNFTNNSDGTATITATQDYTATDLAVGDTIDITAPAGHAGRYTVSGNITASGCNINILEDGNSLGNETGTLDFQAYSTVVDPTNASETDGVLADATPFDGTRGTLTTTSGNFTTAGVAATDYVRITAGTGPLGVYKIVSVDSATVLTLDTSDVTGGFTGETGMTFVVVGPGMYLQYKNEDIASVVPGNTSIDFSIEAGDDTITTTGGTWSTSIGLGTVITIANAEDAANNVSLTVKARTSATILTLASTDSIPVDNIADTTATFTAKNNFVRAIGSDSYGFKWRLFGNLGTAAECFQYIQRRLREAGNIDEGGNVTEIGNGDVVDLLMSFTSPNGIGLNTFIDDLAIADVNNVTYNDNTDTNRVFPFVAGGNILPNINLQNDTAAEYTMFFTNANGNVYSNINAIIVNDNSATPITGLINAQSQIAFDFDYDGNVQGGRTAATNAPITLVGIGLGTAQFVIVTGTIVRSTTNAFSMVSSLERNFLDPSGV